MYKYQMDKEQAINYIKRDVFPDISNKDADYIASLLVDKQLSWGECIKRYKHRKRYDKWERSKDKHYYQVTTMNGGKKIVYMCEKQVIYTYHRFGLIKNLEDKTTFVVSVLQDSPTRVFVGVHGGATTSSSILDTVKELEDEGIIDFPKINIPNSSESSEAWKYPNFDFITNPLPSHLGLARAMLE